MAGGVKPPGGPTYTSNTPTGDETPTSPVVNPKPQIPRTPGQAPTSILKNRSAQKTTLTPQVNQKAREKVELTNESQNLVAQLQHLQSQQQFIEYKDALMDAIADPEALPADFEVVYIDKHGQEVSVIPPAPQLQSDPGRGTQLRNQLKAKVYELDELLADEDAEDIEEAIEAAAEKLESCNQALELRGGQSLARPEAPGRVCLEPATLIEGPKPIPVPRDDVFVLDDKTVSKTPKKQQFQEKDFSNQWLAF